MLAFFCISSNIAKEIEMESSRIESKLNEMYLHYNE